MPRGGIRRSSEKTKQNYWMEKKETVADGKNKKAKYWQNMQAKVSSSSSIFQLRTGYPKIR